MQLDRPKGKRVVFGRDSEPMGGKYYRALYVTDSKPIVTGSSSMRSRQKKAGVRCARRRGPRWQGIAVAVHVIGGVTKPIDSAFRALG